MWDGPRPGPRGGPLLRGDHRGEMFDGRECPAPDFRGRDSMHMGHRPPDRPPMDMRRFDRQSDMNPRDMEPLDMRGRDQNRDFFRPGGEGDLGVRRRFEMEMRNKFQGPPDFTGPPRHPLDMGGRDMKPRGLRDVDEGFMGIRDRERCPMDMPGFNEPPMDARRRNPMDAMGRGEGFRDLHGRERPRMGMEDKDGFNMPPREREMMERRTAPPLNPRGRFESDVDFRNRMRPPADFRERERSPRRFGDNDGVPMDVRGKPDMPPDFGGINRPKFRGGEGNFRDLGFSEQREPPMGFRGREGEPPSDEWHGRDMRERGPFLPHVKGGPPPFPKGRERFPPARGREGGPAGPPEFPGGERPPVGIPIDKDGGFGFRNAGREASETPNWERNAPPDHHFPGQDLPPFGCKGPQEPLRPHMEPPPLNVLNRDNDAKRWPRDQEPKQNQNVPVRGRPPYFRGVDAYPAKAPTAQEHLAPDSHAPFSEPKNLAPDHGPERGKLAVELEKFPDESHVGERRDQDYRDIDYRTGSGRSFNYDHGDQQGTEKIPKDPKPVQAPRFNDSGSQDQDYRSATVKEKVSNTISITGIPKTATMEQILGAFAVRDGVPMQGMKIKNVVPGYSYDTAYVEFLNLEDAVHFMESNQVALPRRSASAVSPGRKKAWAGSGGGRAAGGDRGCVLLSI